ncbi:Quercetin 2,3-dioxygenase [Mycobacterium basiliense]|uniref:Quercetin 2,3-dioxygenase n=1 Tax=Mycobacterium basiliense TaxID=2094119 RepID=A0A447G9F7_9MYCO|nr:cupin domain-containing protein [Mycobacterium basiliense]VDM87109.1 Quercetin 2,3-dioxygenase [Mycobacterium basiliense]
MSLALPPYPPSRYSGDEGEVSARLKHADEPPDYELGGTKYRYLATQASTDGDFGLFRVDIAPAGGGPGPHFHKTMSESFFILSGTMRMHDGRDWVHASAGDYLYVPPGGVHGFRNDADEPASILILFAPGGPREAYFEGLAGLGDMTDEERSEFFIRHDNYWVQ